MGWFLLAISLALTAASCRAGMRLLAETPMDRLWVRILIIPIQLGLCATITSLMGAFDGVPFLVVQAAMATVLWSLWLRFGGPSHPATPTRLGRPRVDPICLIMLILITMLIAVSLVHGLWLSLFGVDERMYHASRVAYWLQNRSIFFYETHNDRQVAFPFGAELFFAWPLLFVKSEGLAQAFHWAAVPTAAAGVWSVCRAMGLGQRASLGGALVYAATPTVLFLGSTLKSDIWQPVFLLGAAYFVLQPRSEGRATLRSWALAGAMLVLAMNIKMTSMALAPGLALVGVATASLRGALRRGLALAAGGAVCACLCGLMVMVVSNLQHFGLPLGPRWMSRIVQPDYSARQIYVHAARTVVYLLEVPEIPSEGLRVKAEKLGNKLSHAIRADKRLSLEDNPVWPGIFTFSAQHTAGRYSLWGILWLPTLGIGVFLVARDLKQKRPLSPPAMLTLLAVPMLVGVVFLIRWMGDGPARFWLGAFALAIPIGARNIERWSAKSGAIAGMSLLALIFTSLATFRGNCFRLDWFVLHPLTQQHIDDRMYEVIPALEPGSRILLAASDSTRDYGLFLPRHGFANQVYPWGKRPFDAVRADQVVKDRAITHIVIENDIEVGFQSSAMDTRHMVDWAKGRTDFQEVPVKPEHVRLFRRTSPSPVPPL